MKSLAKFPKSEITKWEWPISFVRTSSNDSKPYLANILITCIVKHTSASLMLNENADPDVRRDMDMGLDKIVPETLPYIHTDEGPDDMVRNSLWYRVEWIFVLKKNTIQPGHLKSGIIGTSLNIPITDGRLNTGTWQG